MNGTQKNYFNKDSVIRNQEILSLQFRSKLESVAGSWQKFWPLCILTCPPLLPVPPVGHHGHRPRVEASLTTPGAGAGAGAETGRGGHDVTCHAPLLSVSRGSEFLLVLAAAGPCQLHLTQRSLRAQFVIWPQVPGCHHCTLLIRDLNPHFFRQGRYFKNPKQLSFNLFSFFCNKYQTVIKAELLESLKLIKVTKTVICTGLDLRTYYWPHSIIVIC
mgnify:CR=1 FL=1